MHRGELTLRFSFEGTFGLAEARRAGGQLESSVRGALVYLDFSHCAQAHAGGLALLVEEITRGGGRPQLVGLSRHDLRILHYLIGAPAEPSGPRLDAD